MLETNFCEKKIVQVLRDRCREEILIFKSMVDLENVLIFLRDFEVLQLSRKKYFYLPIRFVLCQKINLKLSKTEDCNDFFELNYNSLNYQRFFVVIDIFFIVCENRFTFKNNCLLIWIKF